MTKDSSQAIIKKYPNRRLYNTQISNYITLEDLFQMIKRGEDFVVVDAKTNTDLTNLTLTQIILEREQSGTNILPTVFLKNLISCYDENTQTTMSKYLEMVMGNFELQKAEWMKLSNTMTKSPIADIGKIWNLEDMTKQNLKFFEDSMKFFTNNITPKK